MLMIAVVVMATVGALAAPYVWLESRPLLPGESGCMMIRADGPRQDCMGKFLLERYDQEGLDGLFDHVRRTYRGDADGGDCHLAMHVVGTDRGAQLPAAARKRAADAALEAPGSCPLGFMHGLIIGMLRDNPASLPDVATKFCGNDPTEGRRICFHAIGHSVELNQSRTAPKICGGFGDTTARRECWGGVYMERARTEQAPTKLCAGTANDAAPEIGACGFQIPNVLRKSRDTDETAEMLPACDNLARDGERRSCAAGAAMFSGKSDASVCSFASAPDIERACSAQLERIQRSAAST
jgi:hypothetical protein